MRRKGYLWVGIVCLFYWILDSIWSYLSYEMNLRRLIFSEPVSYIDTFLLKVPPYQIVSRLMTVALFAVIGLLIVEFMKRRHSIEKAQTEAHDTLLSLMNSIDATIYVSDIRSNEILFMNQRMIEAYGGDFTGQLCYEAFRNNDDICDNCPAIQLTDGSDGSEDMFFWEGQNPVTGAWYANYDRTMKWHDGRDVHLQIATDITQLRKLQEKQRHTEAQLRQSQKIEAIGNLAGGIAHDFNNILTAIIGYTNLALYEAERGSTTEDNLQGVLKAGMRAKELVNQILAFARKSEDEQRPIQPSTILKEVLKFIRSTIPTTVEIRHSISSDSYIIGNPTQIHQILINLCTNAAQAMEDGGGIIDVQLEDIKITNTPEEAEWGLPSDDYLKLRISDTGIGIPPDIMDSIYEPYFTTKGLGEGTGMGLAVVHGIVESSGGKIFVESKVGEGTTFTIFLPKSKEREIQSTIVATDLPTGTERVFIIDDEEAITEMVSRILTRLGYSVTTANSGNEALDLFRSSPQEYDLVVTDMTMPNITGDKLAAEIKSIRSDIPVILCTGYSKEIPESAFSEGKFVDILYKPFIHGDLANAVRNALDGV